jgi:hypothetical protein
VSTTESLFPTKKGFYFDDSPRSLDGNIENVWLLNEKSDQQILVKSDGLMYEYDDLIVVEFGSTSFELELPVLILVQKPKSKFELHMVGEFLEHNAIEGELVEANMLELLYIPSKLCPPEPKLEK